MTARRKVSDREEAEALLAAQAASGLSLKESCTKGGLDGRSLQCWRINLRRPETAAMVSPAVRLLELSVAGDGHVAGAHRRASYLVHVGDIAIEVDDDFRNETLGRLLRSAGGRHGGRR